VIISVCKSCSKENCRFCQGTCLSCHDEVCAFVSAVGIAVDGLQVCVVPSLNVRSIVNTPISVGCKVFVWSCKRSKFPWVVKKER
jgi:hypothetical protein